MLTYHAAQVAEFIQGAAVKQGQVELGARVFVEALLNDGPGSLDAVPHDLQAMLKENARTLPLPLMSPPPPPIREPQLQQLHHTAWRRRILRAIGRCSAPSWQVASGS